MKWATKIDNNSINWNHPLSKGKIESSPISVGTNGTASTLYVYAYVNISEIGLEGTFLQVSVKKFYYKGTKQWGKIQKYDDKGNLSFYATAGKVTNEIVNKNATKEGKSYFNVYKALSIDSSKQVYENSILGTRKALSPEIANKVINHFYNGNGKKLSFDENSKLGKDLKRYKYFQEYFNNYLEVIKYMIKEGSINTKDGDEIKNIFVEKLSFKEYRPNFSIPTDILLYP